jgi:hypothetical protein
MNELTTVPLQPIPELEQTVPLSPAIEDNTVSPALADKRAKKIRETTVSDLLGRSQSEISNEIMIGKEQDIRNEVANRLHARSSSNKQWVIGEIARRRGTPLTMEEYNTIMSTQEIFDPTTVLEEQYVAHYNGTLKKGLDPALDLMEATPEDKKYARDFIDEKAPYLIINEILHTARDNLQEKIEKQSTAGYLYDTAKSMLPGYTQVQTRGLVPGSGFTTGGTTDVNYEQQALLLYSKTPAEAKAAVDAVLSDLGEANPQAALLWIESMLGQSSSEKFLNKVFDVIDVATFPGVGSAVKGAFRGTGSAVRAFSRKAARDVAEETANPSATKATIQEAAGAVDDAAVTKAAERLTENIAGKSSPASAILEKLPTAFRVDMEGLWKNPGRLAEEGARRLEAAYQRTIDNLLDVIGNRVNVERLGAIHASEAVLKELQGKLKELYPHLSDGILDASRVTYDRATNTYPVELVLGKSDGSLFKTNLEAYKWAKNHGLAKEGIKVQNKGAGWYITASKPLKETDDIVRDLLIKTGINQDPDSWLNAWVGWLRNPDETLSIEQRMNRKAASYGANPLLKLAKEEAKAIDALRRGASEEGKIWNPWTKKKRWDEFNRVLDATKRLEGPDGIPGRFFENAGELENFYLNMLKRMPDQAEIEAYFAYKRITELDRVLRNLALYRNKARVGTESHQFKFKNPDGEEVLSGWFDGVLHNRLPRTEKDSVMVLEPNGKVSVYGTDNFPSSKKKIMERDIIEGRLKVIEIYDPESRPFQSILGNTNNRVRYVIVNNVESKPISWDQIPRRGAGHFEYDYEWYIKQAKIRPQKNGNKFVHWYEGDNTILAVPIRKMGEEFARHLDIVRTHIKNKRFDEAKAYVNKSNLDVGYDEILEWFRPHKVDGVLHPPRLDVNEPIRLVQRGKKLSDVDDSIQQRYPKTFRDGTKQGSLARQHQIEYSNQRDVNDLFAINNEGNTYNPIWKRESARFVDPLVTMDRAMSRIINSTMLDDYKIFSVETWLQKAKDYLKNPEEAKFTPFHTFTNPEFRPGVDPEIEKNLKTTRWQIQQFLGMRNDYENLLYSTSQKVADSIYSRFGSRAIIIDPVEVLPKLKDPLRFLRSVAFNFKLGLFAVPQLLVQAQTFGVIYGIAGHKMASSGAAATLMTQWSRLNRNSIDKLDEVMSKFHMPGTARWRPGEFKESLEIMKRTGFYDVMGEHAMRDDIQGPRVLSHFGSKFLDAGQFFFREGERASRIGAWHTAYKEFREVKPFGALTNRDIRTILERADTLTVNMSRASSSALHTGIMAVPAQFLAYQIRLSELVLGKRLTQLERMRLFGVQSILYGVPTALGISGLPLADFMRKNALENGYVVGENAFEQAVTEGIPALLLGLITGNQYNVGDRFGSNGFETIREAMRGDRTWWEVAGGAAGSTAINTLYAMKDGFGWAMLSGLKADGNAFGRTTIDDAADIFKEISSVNQTWKVIMALQTGRWLSKKELNLTDVSAGNAIFLALTGMSPQSVTDLQLKSWSLKDQNEMHKYVADLFTKDFRRGLREHTNNPEQAKLYFKRAFDRLEISGYPEHKRSEVMSRAIRDHESLVESMDWNFYLKNAPKSQEAARLKAFTETLRQRQRGTN